MFNPFYRVIKGDDILEDEVRFLFVKEASPIWDQVQEPINQMIIGPKGAGKTILLKRLHYSNVLKRDGISFLGIYIQISKLSNIFRQLYKSPSDMDQGEHLLERSYQKVFEDYLCIEILMRLIASANRYLQSINKSFTRTEIKEIIGTSIDIKSYSDLEQFYYLKKESIERQFSKWQMSKTCDWENIFEISSTIDRLSSNITQILNKKLSNRTQIYLLLDESCQIPLKCQEVINILLQRGRSYKTKLAVRPYDWFTLQNSLGVCIEEGTDFQKLYIEYPDELTEDYISKMRSIINNILETRIFSKEGLPRGWEGIGKTDALEMFSNVKNKAEIKYAGFKDICALSSSNPQNLIGICSMIFSLAIENNAFQRDQKIIIPATLQSQAMAAWSKEKEQEISDLNIKQFCRALLKYVRNLEHNKRSISFRFKHRQPDLFTAEELPIELGEKLKSSFSQGILRHLQIKSAGLWRVPSNFRITRSLLPFANIPLHTTSKNPIDMDINFITKNYKERIGGQKKDKKFEFDIKNKTLKAFLSTSFSPLAENDRKSIKKYLGKMNIECLDLDDKDRGMFLIPAILRAIKSTDFTVLNATILTPYTMFELGLCAGLKEPKQVICLFNDEGDPEKINKLPNYMKSLAIISYNDKPEKLNEMANKVRSEANSLLLSTNEFINISETGQSLRPKRAQKTIYLSFPSQYPIWESALDEIRNFFEKKRGLRVITEKDSEIYLANSFQSAIYCSHLAGPAIVDTSGSKTPDLMQCFKFGVCYARRNWPVLRTEQIGKSQPNALGTDSDYYLEWTSLPELMNGIKRFINGTKKNKGT